MRKLFYAIALMFMSVVTYGQAVNESAIIPVSVTLNAVSRLNIESGGNIKFVFTSIDDYKTGFASAGGDLYATTFSVASSRDFSILMYAESDHFLPTDDATHTNFTIDNLEYTLVWQGGVGGTIPTTFDNVVTSMTNDDTHLAITDGTAGDGTDNRFEIRWRIGVTASILSQNIEPDHYVANVFIELTN